ncbi:hypothetical protein D3C78_383910 [compost metagenome]
MALSLTVVVPSAAMNPLMSLSRRQCTQAWRNRAGTGALSMCNWQSCAASTSAQRNTRAMSASSMPWASGPSRRKA